MKDFTYTDIQSFIDKNIDISNILIDIEKIMEMEYPQYVCWFNEKVIPGLYSKERNIILIFKKNILIGFVNLKKTKNERKMSNLYIKKGLFYNKHFFKIIDLAMTWLETDHPSLIISNNELEKCAQNLFNKKWNTSSIIKKDNNSLYYVFNGYDEYNEIKKLLQKKRKDYINNN